MEWLDFYNFDEMLEYEAPTTTEEEVQTEKLVVESLKQDFQEQFVCGMVSLDHSLQEKINVVEVLPLYCHIAQKDEINSMILITTHFQVIP